MIKAQVRNDLLLPTLDPPGEHGEPELEDHVRDHRGDTSNSRSRLVRPIRAMSERVSLVHLTNSSVDFEAPLAREGVSNSAHCSV
jgi:hypothetical protein